MSMATSSSSLANSLKPLGPPVTEKLSRENFILWKAQVMPSIRGANLVAILTGKSPAPAQTMEVIKDDKSKQIVLNPEYEMWMVQDQRLLAYIFNSLSAEVLAQVTSLGAGLGSIGDNVLCTISRANHQPSYADGELQEGRYDRQCLLLQDEEARR
jgi:hypothetical protein